MALLNIHYDSMTVTNIKQIKGMTVRTLLVNPILPGLFFFFLLSEPGGQGGKVPPYDALVMKLGTFSARQ